MKTINSRGGFILPMVLILLVVLTTLGLTLLMMSRSNVEQIGNSRADQVSINKAQERYQKTLTAIQANSYRDASNNELLDTNGNSFIDIGDTAVASTGGVTLQNDTQGKTIVKGEFRSCADPSILRDHFLIKTSGVIGNSKKTIIADVEFKSFLHYARFCDNTVSYGPGAVISGEFYSGGSISVSGPTVKFLKDVTTVSPFSSLSGFGTMTIPNHVWANVRIDGTLVTSYSKPLSLAIGSQVTTFFSQAVSCGWNITAATGRNCLGNSHTNEGGSSTDNLLNLSYLKNLDTDHPTYDDGSPGPGNCTGANAYALPSNFNGVIAWQSASNSYSVHVEGTLGSDNKGKSVSVFSNMDIYIEDDINTQKDSNNKPVNVGLVADGSGAQILISVNAPIFLTVHAALMSSQSNWQSLGATSSAGLNTANLASPPKFAGPSFDLDGDGILNISDKYGYNENSLTPTATVLLRIIGPIITATSGSSGLYACNSDTNCNYGTGKTTRDYSYDVDILVYPPPFPRVKNLLHLVSYTETDEPL